MYYDMQLQVDTCSMTHRTMQTTVPLSTIEISYFDCTFEYITQVNAVIIVIALRKIYVNRRLQKSENSDSDMKTNAIKAM